MACCLTAPSHYLIQCWLIISKTHWHSSGSHFTRDNSAINRWNQFENYLSKYSHSALPGTNGLKSWHHSSIAIIPTGFVSFPYKHNSVEWVFYDAYKPRPSKQSQFIAWWEDTVADFAEMIFFDKPLLVLHIIFYGYWQRIAVFVAVLVIFYAMESIVEHLLLSIFCGFACPDPMKRPQDQVDSWSLHFYSD